jgi:hypothetical protein
MAAARRPNSFARCYEAAEGRGTDENDHANFALRQIGQFG